MVDWVKLCLVSVLFVVFIPLFMFLRPQNELSRVPFCCHNSSLCDDLDGEIKSKDIDAKSKYDTRYKVDKVRHICDDESDDSTSGFYTWEQFYLKRVSNSFMTDA
jgi:hypothetical protein